MSLDGKFAADVYAWILQQPSATAEDVQKQFDVPRYQAERILWQLAELRLVSNPEEGPVVGTGPSRAHAELIEPMEREICERRLALSEFQARLKHFGDVFDMVQRSGLRHESSGGAVTLRGGDELRHRLAEAAARCEGEALLMLSGDGALGEVVEACPLGLVGPVLGTLLRRGAAVRVVAPHTLRAHPRARAQLGGVAADGALVRTAPAPPEKLLLFDRSVAFVFPPAGEPTATLVQDSAMVAVLDRVYDSTWESGVELADGTVGYGEAFGAVQDAILELLATGRKDEVIARRLGMSERTFRRHVAALMDQLGVCSRFQAGVLAAQTGLVPDLHGAPGGHRTPPPSLLPGPRRLGTPQGAAALPERADAGPAGPAGAMQGMR
ncbi:LuxR C-terminal-related transcriptional regulator [Streptomyces mauvecolor]|uniref:LuxR C-terminal-related transcriptional regulator n=1 Tax=Streptomyces mauvecolor TaxID=58345 RepID=A0ABV9UWF5_9ACTN